MEEAQARFARALDRMEAALRRSAERAGEETAALRADRDRMAGDIDRLRQENLALRTAARTVSGRLGAATAQVRALLDG